MSPELEGVSPEPDSVAPEPTGVSPRSTPFTEADAGFAYFAQPGESICIQAEIHFTGRLDPERLLGAAQAACRRHPMARARRAPLRKGDRAYRWEILDEATPDLEIVECLDERDLCLVRDRLLNDPPSLDAAPLFKLGLVRRVEGDALIMTIPHSLSDGLGVWRILTSILRAYAGLEDPLPAIDPLRARELRPLAVPATRRERLRRLSRLPRLLLASSRPVRMAPQGAGGAGEGIFLLTLDEQETAMVADRKGEGSTVNDVMLAGMVLAIRRWNADRGQRPGKVCLIVPVNLRLADWFNEVPGNFASGFPVAIPRREPDTLSGLVEAVTKRTQKAKRDRTANAMFDFLLTILRPWPFAVKRGVGARNPHAVERTQETVVFSNLGRLELPELGGEAGSVQATWISPPARLTRGFAIAVFSLGGCLRFGMRYQRAHFDEGAAAEFAQLYRSVLLGELEARPLADRAGQDQRLDVG